MAGAKHSKASDARKASKPDAKTKSARDNARESEQEEGGARTTRNRNATGAKKETEDDLDQTTDVLGDTRAVKQPALRSGNVMSDAIDPDKPDIDPEHPLDLPEIDPKDLLAPGAKPIVKPRHAVGDEEGKSPETGPPAGPDGPEEVDTEAVVRAAGARSGRTSPNQSGQPGRPTNPFDGRTPRVGDHKRSVQERKDEKADKKG